MASRSFLRSHMWLEQHVFTDPIYLGGSGDGARAREGEGGWDTKALVYMRELSYFSTRGKYLLHRTR